MSVPPFCLHPINCKSLRPALAKVGEVPVLRTGVGVDVGASLVIGFGMDAVAFEVDELEKASIDSCI